MVILSNYSNTLNLIWRINLPAYCIGEWMILHQLVNEHKCPATKYNLSMHPYYNTLSNSLKRVPHSLSNYFSLQHVISTFTLSWIIHYKIIPKTLKIFCFAAISRKKRLDNSPGRHKQSIATEEVDARSPLLPHKLCCRKTLCAAVPSLLPNIEIMVIFTILSISFYSCSCQTPIV